MPESHARGLWPEKGRRCENNESNVRKRAIPCCDGSRGVAEVQLVEVPSTLCPSNMPRQWNVFYHFRSYGSPGCLTTAFEAAHPLSLSRQPPTVDNLFEAPAQAITHLPYVCL